MEKDLVMENTLNNKYRSLDNERLHCCFTLWTELTPITTPDLNSLVIYNPIWKNYSIVLPSFYKNVNRNTQYRSGRSAIYYCSWCGAKFKDYTDDWYEYLAKDYQIVLKKEESWDNFFKRVPEEFKTDEWWIKRGL